MTAKSLRYDKRQEEVTNLLIEIHPNHSNFSKALGNSKKDLGSQKVYNLPIQVLIIACEDLPGLRDVPDLYDTERGVLVKGGI